ncbi:MAG: PH domain-containing protein [Myxococcales bacterium]|nr:PH domain-containing protein [Myxococcales bacterium]
MIDDRPVSIYRGTLGAGGLWWYYVGFGVFITLGCISQRELLTAAAVLALTALLALRPLSRWRQTLTIEPGGVVWRGLVRERRVPRDQVLGARADWHAGEMSSWPELVLHLPLGKQLRLRGLADSERAAAELTALPAPPAAPATAPATAVYGRRPTP